VTTPDVVAWWKGDPEAIEVGTRALKRVRALRDKKTIRQAVELVQKRAGAVPTGTLSRDQWVQLLDEASLLPDDGEPDEGDEPDTDNTEGDQPDA
jgi:hypothetical protein